MYVDTGQGGAAPTLSGGSRGRLIDYEQAYAGRRQPLSEAAAAAFQNPESKVAMERFADPYFGMADYCRFRAASALIGEP